MALKRATKSIPLMGGTIEEANDLLMEPPGMQFVLNGRHPKKDECVKGKSYAPGKITGYANYTSNVYGTWGKGDKLGRQRC